MKTLILSSNRGGRSCHFHDSSLRRPVEEALSNAIYHKSYQIGEPITVTITPDRMEITSLPGPDRTISDEDIQNRRMISRRYRNRRIGDFLKKLKLVEGRNTGIPTILRAMAANGSRPPIFETDADRTYFTAILPVHDDFLSAAEPVQPQGKPRRRALAEVKELAAEGKVSYSEAERIHSKNQKICLMEGDGDE